MKKINLSIIARSLKNGEMFYRFTDNDSTIIKEYSHSFMTKWVDYHPSMLDSDGYLREGVYVQFYVKQDAMGRTQYFPDQSKYWPKNKAVRESISLSTNQNSLDYSDKQEFNISKIASKRPHELIRSALNRINDFDSTEKEQLTDCFLSNDIQKACDLIKSVLSVPFFPEESQELEYKEGIDNRELVKESLGFANSRTEGTIICGIQDKTRDVVGVEKFFATTDSLEKCKTSILNSFSQTVSNTGFLNSLSLEWYQYEEHLILVISIPRWEGDYLFYNGKELYLRKDAMNRSLSAAEVYSLKQI